MATYWAELDANNIVKQVITGVDDLIIDGLPAQTFYTNFVGSICVQTWLNRNEKTYAGIGYLYSFETENFIDPNPPTPNPPVE